ncbi:hypothetical protein DVH24_034653 [Malus domestica]|uniref:Uncharacterized protein n=1 Tax=Malus domestica TaxID=3750 RepID=A0A498J1Q0_MALDO|nr:hypothetical protein DVH24_034653 [Malus domestica]
MSSYCIKTLNMKREQNGPPIFTAVSPRCLFSSTEIHTIRWKKQEEPAASGSGDPEASGSDESEVDVLNTLKGIILRM